MKIQNKEGCVLNFQSTNILYQGVSGASKYVNCLFLSGLLSTGYWFFSEGVEFALDLDPNTNTSLAINALVFAVGVFAMSTAMGELYLNNKTPKGNFTPLFCKTHCDQKASRINECVMHDFRPLTFMEKIGATARGVSAGIKKAAPIIGMSLAAWYAVSTVLAVKCADIDINEQHKCFHSYSVLPDFVFYGGSLNGLLSGAKEGVKTAYKVRTLRVLEACQDREIMIEQN